MDAAAAAAAKEAAKIARLGSKVNKPESAPKKRTGGATEKSDSIDEVNARRLANLERMSTSANDTKYKASTEKREPGGRSNSRGGSTPAVGTMKPISPSEERLMGRLGEDLGSQKPGREVLSYCNV